MADAYEIPGQQITIEANADLSTKQFYAVDMNTSRKLVVASVLGQDGVGVLQNKPAAAGRAATVMIDGVTKAVAGATIDEGDSVTAMANGKFQAAASTHKIWGTALTNASSGELFALRLLPAGAVVP